jgi:transglutaminase-like putative cysteine protease
MEEHLLVRLLKRFQPRFGWLPFALLVGALACLLFSVLEVGWVAEDSFMVPIILLGFLSATLLAQRPVRPLIAWLILVAAGLGLALVLIAELWPPATVFERGMPAIGDYWRIRAALFADRAAGWLSAVRGGGRSTETVVFALGLAVAGWFVAALLAWSVYRVRRPFWGLTLVGIALALNTFYGQAALYWAVFFFGLAITAGTYLTHLNRELEWESRGTDYSAEVRSDLLIYTAGISLGIMSLAMGIPAINFRAIADAFQRQEAVVVAEQTLARAFAGVAQPRTDEGTAGGGGMPRSFLLGGGPELADTVVMTATLRADSPADLSAFHWRSVSFDVYTGRGWQRSAERQEFFARAEPIPPAAAAEGGGRRVRIAQDVDWLYDRRATRYTLGRPVLFSHDITVAWRGRDDLVGVLGRNNAPSRYTAETTVIAATADQLRAATPADIPPEIQARYTELPDTVPARVIELAREITAPNPTGDGPLPTFDQARAIETFLHQYPYSLDLPPPPPDVDIVDYFLFDLQTGFCDYYASAMVVMARAVGLPARLGVGFLQQPPDAAGIQTLSQLNAHSWAEIYFAGYGWVEFEPTAPFAAPAPIAPAPDATSAAPPTYTPGGLPVTIPERAPQRDTPWPLLVGLAAAALVGWRLFGQRLRDLLAPRYTDLDDVQIAFARLQDGAAALGHPHHPAQTPAEFATGLLAAPALHDPESAQLRPAVDRLTALFNDRQYGGASADAAGQEAKMAWRAAQSPLRRLAWRRRFGRQH